MADASPTSASHSRPGGLRRRWLWGVLREAGRRFEHDHHAVYAGHMAFTILLSLGPFVVCAIFLAAFIDPAASSHLHAMIHFMRDSALAPESMTTMLTDLVDSLSPRVASVIDAAHNPGATGVARIESWRVVAITALVGLWAGSSAFEAARNGFNVAYDAREQRSVYFRRTQSILLALVIVLMFAAASFTFVLGAIAAQEFSQISTALPGGDIVRAVPLRKALLIAGVGCVAVIFWLLLLGIHVTLPRGYVKGWHIYVWSQDEIDDIRAVKIPLLPGVHVSAALWLTFAICYSLVIGWLVHLDGNHGRLGGVVATLIFFYVSSAMIFFGAQINIALATTGADGQPKWPHPAVERPENFDECAEEAARMLLRREPTRRARRLLHRLSGGRACERPIHHVEEARLRRAASSDPLSQPDGSPPRPPLA